jgi:hypothetical protein
MTTANIPLGPGTLKIGATGSELDVSCLVNNAKITPNKDQGDSKTKLCGDVSAGAVDYTFALTGNVDQDVAMADGLSALCWESAGTEQGFTFTPNTAAGASAVGTLVLDPLDFGGDEYGEDMTSDFEFTIVGKPTITWGTGITGASSEGQSEDADAEDTSSALVGA